MSLHRHALPQLDGGIFITDGGLETTLVFHERVDLPHFAAFPLIRSDEGRRMLAAYYERYASIARCHRVGAVLETATWRANADWGAKLGYDANALAAVNRDCIAMLESMRASWQGEATPIVISGNLGPRDDGYAAQRRMTADEARRYHAPQVETFASTSADMVAAFTMNYVDEAIGIASAARDAQMPVAISFTVETDGRLPSGEPLADAIERTDAATAGHPAYYMINCAHPTHFARTLEQPGSWRGRLRGLRANASAKSHAELDESAELDVGDPADLAAHYAALQARLPLAVVGGCCGTDHRHVEAICRATAGRPMR